MDTKRVQTDQQILTGTELIFVHEDESIRWLAWEQATSAWLQSKRRRTGRSNTTRAYQIAVRQFFKWAADVYGAGDQLPPWHVTPLICQEWTRHLGDQGLASSTINLKLAALGSLYDFVRRRYTATDPHSGTVLSLWPADRANPFDAVERARIDPYSRAKFPTTDELIALLASINTDCLTGKRDFALLYTFAVTCRRSGELLSLKWGDIEHDPLPDGNYTYSYNVLKKGQNQIRRAVLDRNCYHAICDYLIADDRLARDRSHVPADDDYIFVAIDPSRITRMRPSLEITDNAPLSNRFANEILKKYARRIGLDEKKAHLHGLRHAGARLRVQQQKEGGRGVDYVEIMHLLQHSSLAVTQIYSQSVLEDPEDPGGRAAADALLPKGEKPRRKKKEALEQPRLL